MATAGAKVIVACKIAVPSFDLQLCEEREVSEDTQTGPRTVKRWFRVGKIITVRGTAYPAGTPPTGFPAKPQMMNGYALTPNVDKDFWEAWLKQHEKAPYVASKMIMAYESFDTVRGVSKDHVGEVSGLEPMSQDRDPRIPRSTNPGVGNVETEETRRGRVAA